MCQAGAGRVWFSADRSNASQLVCRLPGSTGVGVDAPGGRHVQTLYTNAAFTIPAAADWWVVTRRLRYSGPEPVRVSAYKVHTHWWGRRMSVRRISVNESQNATGHTILSASPVVQNWRYDVARDSEIQPGDQVVVECVYDASARNELLRSCDSHMCEMCWIYMQVSSAVAQRSFLNVFFKPVGRDESRPACLAPTGMSPGDSPTCRRPGGPGSCMEGCIAPSSMVANATCQAVAIEGFVCAPPFHNVSVLEEPIASGRAINAHLRRRPIIGALPAVAAVAGAAALVAAGGAACVRRLPGKPAETPDGELPTVVGSALE